MKRQRPGQINNRVEMDEGEEQDLSINPARSRRSSGRRRLINRLIPIAMIGFIAIIILREEVPAFNDFLQSNSDPKGFAAIKACREAALENTTAERYKRLIRYGKSHPTADGYFVDNIVLGELDANGGESRIAVTCHIDSAGVVVDLNRTRPGSNADSGTDFATGSEQTAF
ncbi:MAG: hypothetical protein ACWA44_03195 [Thiotrichales bacterium]